MKLLNVFILNSRILLESSSRKHHDHLAFRLQLVQAIVENHISHCPQNHVNSACNSISTVQGPKAVVNTHWPILLEQTETSVRTNRKFCKRCVVCLREGRKSQKTAYCCEKCKVPLCINNCFKSYHM